MIPNTDLAVSPNLSLKDLEHYGKDPVVCGIQVSKYLERFILAAQLVLTRQAAHPDAAAVSAELAAMVAPNAKLKAMRGNKDLPRDEAPALIELVAGALSPEAYANKMTRINILVNAIARGCHAE